MKQRFIFLVTLILSLSNSLNLAGQTINRYTFEFGKIVIDLPDKPEVVSSTSGHSFNVNIPQGIITGVFTDLSLIPDFNLPEDSIRSFYKKGLQDAATSFNATAKDIRYFTIGSNEGVFYSLELPMTSGQKNKLFNIQLIIGKESYSVSYFNFRNPDNLEYTKDTFINLIKLK